mgnify:CR=1 FL=1
MRRKITAEAERALAERIWAAEDAAREALRAIPSSEQILGTVGTRRWSTRARGVAILGIALSTAIEQSPRAPSLRHARTAWAEADRFRWELALTAERVITPEATKIARAVGMDADDLRSEGAFGLYDAAVRFDPAKGIRFMTYAKWWVRARMTRAVDRGGRAIRIAGGAVETRRQLWQAENELRKKGSAPTLDAMAALVGVSVDRAREVLNSGDVVSFEIPINEEGGTMGDTIPSSGASPEEAVGFHGEIARLGRAILQLPNDRYRTVLVRRFGLDGEEPRTLAEVGKEIGFSRERVRQIEEEAMGQLRSLVRRSRADIVA